MNDRFDQFFERALKHEGKVCEDVPGDRGGPTKWGVTIGRLATMKRVKEPARGSAAFAAMKEELFALSEAQIKDIYRKDYWDAVRADDLPDGLDYAVADFGLNSGPSRAVKALQKLLGNPQTGRMDYQTIKEANAFDRIELIMLYCDERARFLNAIVSSNASQRKFLKGWLTRVGDVRRASIKDAEKAPVDPERSQQVSMPKAEPLPPPPVVKVAARSFSVKALFYAFLAWLETQFKFISDMLPNIASETQDVVDPLTSLGGLLKINMGGVVATVSLIALAVVLYRHVRDKRELETLKGESE